MTIKIQEDNLVVFKIHTSDSLLIETNDIEPLITILQRCKLIYINYNGDIQSLTPVNSESISIRFVSKEIIKRYVAKQALKDKEDP